MYAVRWEPHGAPEAVFCYGNNKYSADASQRAIHGLTERGALGVLQEGQLGDRAAAVCGPCGSYAMAVVAGSGDLGADLKYE